jgi:TolA-binding protein
MLPAWAIQLGERIAKTAPMCASGILLMGALLFSYSAQNYASAADLQDLSTTINQNFNVLLCRLNLSDAERVVSDVQGQIRQKEREIADLEIVISDIALSSIVGTGSTSQNTLRDRAFELNQDLTELRARLDARIRDQQRARDALADASR